MADIEPTEAVTCAAITAGAGMFQTAALVAALIVQFGLDPIKVVAYAEFFAETKTGGLPAHISDGVAAQVRDFATLIRAMAEMPARAGNA